MAQNYPFCYTIREAGRMAEGDTITDVRESPDPEESAEHRSETQSKTGNARRRSGAACCARRFAIHASIG